MIYVFFKPLEIKEQEFIEVPMLELKTFTIYELTTEGLKTILFGEESQRFSDRYTVKNVNYTDNEKEYVASMKADTGVYKNDNIDLKGDVVYTRDDGLVFESQEASYDKKTGLVSTNADFIIHQGQNSVVGVSLKHNNLTQKTEAQKIEAIYQLQESKK